MGRFSRLRVWEMMERLGLVPLYHCEDAEVARRIAEALAGGGARVIEFANRGERAFETFRQVVTHMERVSPEVILGVGSVLDAPTASLYIDLGANFVVSPATHVDVAKLCNRLRIAYFPGCGTATEISFAEELGVQICKVFPASQIGGPGLIRAIKGPCPQSKLMPTGGVDTSLESLQEWFDAGATCVGKAADSCGPMLSNPRIGKGSRRSLRTAWSGLRRSKRSLPWCRVRQNAPWRTVLGSGLLLQGLARLLGRQLQCRTGRAIGRSIRVCS